MLRVLLVLFCVQMSFAPGPKTAEEWNEHFKQKIKEGMTPEQKEELAKHQQEISKYQARSIQQKPDSLFSKPSSPVENKVVAPNPEDVGFRMHFPEEEEEQETQKQEESSRQTEAQQKVAAKKQPGLELKGFDVAEPEDVNAQAVPQPDSPTKPDSPEPNTPTKPDVPTKPNSPAKPDAPTKRDDAPKPDAKKMDVSTWKAENVGTMEPKEFKKLTKENLETLLKNEKVLSKLSSEQVQAIPATELAKIIDGHIGTRLMQFASKGIKALPDSFVEKMSGEQAKAIFDIHIKNSKSFFGHSHFEDYFSKTGRDNIKNKAIEHEINLYNEPPKTQNTYAQNIEVQVNKLINTSDGDVSKNKMLSSNVGFMLNFHNQEPKEMRKLLRETIINDEKLILYLSAKVEKFKDKKFNALADSLSEKIKLIQDRDLKFKKYVDPTNPSGMKASLLTSFYNDQLVGSNIGKLMLNGKPITAEKLDIYYMNRDLINNMQNNKLKLVTEEWNKLHRPTK